MGIQREQLMPFERKFNLTIGLANPHRKKTLLPRHVWETV